MGSASKSFIKQYFQYFLGYLGMNWDKHLAVVSGRLTGQTGMPMLTHQVSEPRELHQRRGKRTADI